jgi:hypothetical protein
MLWYAPAAIPMALLILPGTLEMDPQEITVPSDLNVMP